MSSAWARASLSHPAFTGISRAHLRELIEELAAPWTARCESVLRHRRGRKRKGQAAAGPKHEPVFTDRVLVTLVHLRFQLPHSAFAELYGLERSTITRAIGEIRPLLARRGYAAPDRPGIRLRTLADVFAYAQAEGVRLRIDGTETQVRRPQAGRPGRRAFVSGKKKRNTIKMTTISDGQGRTLWSGADRPGRMHDQTAMRTEGIAEQFRLHPAVKAEVDEGYRGLAADAQGLCSRVVRCAGGCRGCASAGVCAVGGRRQRHCSARACPATAVTSGSAGAAVGRGSGFSKCFGTARRGCSCPIRLG